MIRLKTGRGYATFDNFIDLFDFVLERMVKAGEL
ncbi:hypothetical protein MBENS4_3353 [Novosphingobium sp. MBES04]|nr:hypothetical protein MBENS4_3353 [Novosphingobium sp. MBES04]